MMNRGNSNNGASRHVLGDVSNQYGKRVLTLDAGKLVDGVRFETSVFGGFGGLGSKRGKSCGPETVLGKGKGPAFANAMPPGQHVIPGFRGRAAQGSARGTRDIPTLQLLNRDADRSKITDVSFGSAPSHSDGSEDTLQESEYESQEDCEIGSVYFARNVSQTEKNQGMSSDASEGGVGFVDLKENKMGSSDMQTQTLTAEASLLGSMGPSSGSIDFKMCGSGKSSNLHAGNNDEDNAISSKSCRCSFCLKAAYMWMDLHYQDTRGRLAALKRSRSLARTSQGKIYTHDQMSKVAPQNPRRTAEMEFDLMQRCTSLFLHTEEALVRETTQLHSSHLRLKELRENCKRELEMISDKS